MKTILVVDDNEDSRELVKKILKKQGYEIIEAVDGEDALAKAIAYRPDLILMDISIPKIDGYEVTKRLKSRIDFKDTPIIAFTAHAMRGDQEKALEAGCDGYISKPINVREFPEQIKIYLKEK
ncbi:two-component system, cell cycle response regulator DivK [Thermodesulfovibrio aggregans]|uniref:Two-component system, cell cycle response regulator DivK n=1 Tax=Thermodesulfovibrio aggregans TaxID=86166 RepID=A0A0U9HSZ0_9BACT|nr:response regulator [Thermodesulfovibrio aggregans]GAQ94874.1 two-component system, cell cycle response regulator DivK [Thermodesulfovibrio aggregans]